MSSKLAGAPVVETERQALFRNAVLTVLIAGPLLFAFLRRVDFYPVPLWNAFAQVAPLGSGPHIYYVLRGETKDGRKIDLPPVQITRALGDGNESLVRAVVSNTSFFVDSPHPRNSQFWTRVGTLPPAARIEDLLRAWGTIYNNRLAEGSPDTLRSIEMEVLQWPREDYTSFQQHKETWRIVLPIS